ncbi:MAG: protocatechuate 4,5-dioxygenase subunit alpha [Roseibium sp.]|uniref:protocatechuate 4,5-dioxygenase subunit alpha n=1 Tax=Roseibium sp. TaxID=1936156 RepID=UPI0026245771|nr:protocatechuate 4,5-dioxygenase subunit alpha [Roseibium sp.]MCV0427186.1 protocatechuate 4,5-dioxygenase subunit alpha [Roseibium sp.]
MTRASDKEYSDIPGTIVFDSDRAEEGYHLNKFCISLRLQRNRNAFKADPERFIDAFPMTVDQREAALNQDWNRLLELGGNIYYTSKLAAFHGINFQELAALMTGMSVTDYRAMMIAGGRGIEGNRYVHEWENKDG